jgi:hypothetical protein
MRIMRSALKANFSSVSLPLSTRLATGWLALVIFVLFGGSVCHAQGTFTAASCNESDVNAVINGPTHKAVNNDTIIIPAGTCTWTTGVAISGVGIDITGTGTPNKGGGTVGAGTSNTTLIANIPGSNNNGAFFAFTGLTFGQTAKVELLNMSAAGDGTFVATGAVLFSGACTTNGCAQIRADNLNFTANTWESALAGGFVVTCNVFGVVDHNSATESVSGSPPMVQISYPAWQGIGDWGDNSFASPDTFGTAQTMFIENNLLSGVRGSENDVSFGGNVGGARYVCRFNTVTNMSGTGLCSAHGTAWTGRPRGQRQVEVYYNTVSGTSCNAIDGLNGGTGYYFSNSFTGTGCNSITTLDIPRISANVSGPWNRCDGTQPWDQSPFTSTSQCLDQTGRGPGLLIQGGNGSSSQTGTILASNPGAPCAGAVVGRCWPNPALDPIYEAGETTPNPATPVAISGAASGRVVLNRDVYAEVSQSPQTSTTSPFSGANGTGYGTLARRPVTCTAGVGYWATDQGTWNTYNSQGGELFICGAGNTWTMSYEPYSYPHPLTAGGTSTTGPTGGNPVAPTSLTATVE